jgi:glycosyltransferase involved in cell wall biosynthesis
MNRSMRVLYVADSIYWITAAIARRIWRFNPWIEPGLLTAGSLRLLLNASNDRLPFPVDVVHFLTPHLATEFRDVVSAHAAVVATIHHIEDEASTEPAQAADAIMTVCDQWHNALIAGGIPAEKCVKIRNTVNPAIFQPASAQERGRIRRRFGIPQDAICIGFSGKRSSNTHGRKGIETFLEAAKLLADSGESICLAITGPGWNDVAEDFRARGVQLVYVPFVLDEGDLAAFYRMLDLYWVTSRIEGGPVPLLEAMASGVCCLSTPVGTALEAIEDGANGQILPHDDAPAFAEASRRLIANPALRQRMRSAARQTILQDFDMADSVSSARELYLLALRNFDLRCGESNLVDAHPSWSEGILKDLPSDLLRRIAAYHHLEFMRFLQNVGATKAARRIALRALCSAPMNAETWRNVYNILPGGARIKRLLWPFISSAN